METPLFGNRNFDPMGRLTARRRPSNLLGTMQARDTGRTGFFGYYFSYRLPGGPMP